LIDIYCKNNLGYSSISKENEKYLLVSGLTDEVVILNEDFSYDKTIITKRPYSAICKTDFGFLWSYKRSLFKTDHRFLNEELVLNTDSEITAVSYYNERIVVKTLSFAYCFSKNGVLLKTFSKSGCFFCICEAGFLLLDKNVLSLFSHNMLPKKSFNFDFNIIVHDVIFEKEKARFTVLLTKDYKCSKICFLS